jgi:hypothetical protein
LTIQQASYREEKEEDEESIEKRGRIWLLCDGAKAGNLEEADPPSRHTCSRRTQDGLFLLLPL